MTIKSDFLNSEVSRRDALKTSAGLGAAALAATSLPLALSLASEEAFAQSTTPAVAMATLQRYENFYLAFLNKIPTTAYPSTATPNPVPAMNKVIAQTQAHVTYFTGAVGAFTPPAYDWTGGGSSAGTGPIKLSGAGIITDAQWRTLLQYFSDYRIRVFLGALGPMVADAKYSKIVAMSTNVARHTGALLRIVNGSSSFRNGANGLAVGTAEPTNLSVPPASSPTVATALTNLNWFIYGPPLATSTATKSEGEDSKESINGATPGAAGFDKPHSVTRVNKVLSFFNA